MRDGRKLWEIKMNSCNIRYGRFYKCQYKIHGIYESEWDLPLPEKEDNYYVVIYTREDIKNTIVLDRGFVFMKEIQCWGIKRMDDPYWQIASDEEVRELVNETIKNRD